MHSYTFSQLPMSLILQGIPMQISAYRLHLLHEICLTCQRAVQKHLSSALSEISERFEPHKGNTRLHTPQPINSEPITQKQAHNNNNKKKRSNTRSQQSCGLHFPFSIYFFPLIFSLTLSFSAFAISFRTIPFTLQRFVLTLGGWGLWRGVILCLIYWEPATTFVRFGSDKCCVKAASVPAPAPVPSLASCLGSANPKSVCYLCAGMKIEENTEKY